ncbi:Aste57867_17904 [Aphanomyces stellatus]|uniref:Aste57867_17904 protein n=1 Tax=Aphanomyces stellatus TaxID=120398 RepID=A0A485L8R2_9STRA|nr:hypothetical protein As57867_017843 [Aphanomyces stellatus]VFT94646.1 Aste57867_17904 [Aphanomyces stellatus]
MAHLPRPPTCIFNGCDHATYQNSAKCWYHRYRDPCQVEGCFNQARARKRCAAHGGKKQPGYNHASHRSTSVFPDSSANTCKRYCIVDGCSKFAHAKYKCVAHGGASLCRVQDCVTQSRNGGLCQRHGNSVQPLASSFSKVDGVVQWRVESAVPLDAVAYDDFTPFDANNLAHLDYIDSTTLQLLLTLTL